MTDWMNDIEGIPLSRMPGRSRKTSLLLPQRSQYKRRVLQIPVHGERYGSGIRRIVQVGFEPRGDGHPDPEFFLVAQAQY